MNECATPQPRRGILGVDIEYSRSEAESGGEGSGGERKFS
jgi:hypothetical protein